MTDSKIISDFRDTIRRIALGNAITHKGKAEWKPVLGMLLGEKPILKKRIKEISSLVKQVIQEVNCLTLKEQTETVKKLWPEILIQKKSKVEDNKELPPLQNVEKYEQVVTRYAPNPNCVLHLGQARAIILSYEYARKYNGIFLLRFEDTDTRLKKSSLIFYDLIRKDLEWLGCKWDAEYIQSDRIEIYYEYAEKILRIGHAYVCTCKREEFRRKIAQKMECPCRNIKPEENINRWDAMLRSDYDEGEAVVRIKTDINHPNPAIRDWPAFRIIDPKKYPHPRVGNRYCVWPLFAFANGIDDHLNKVTHIIRGKEHLTNQRRQEYLYLYLGWDYPDAIHYGRLKISGAALSKSKIIKGIQEKIYTGWDDPKLATFRSLERRGIKPEAIKQIILSIGPSPVDITLSWPNLYSYNRKLIDSSANRFFFIQEPIELVINEVPRTFTAQLPFHPEHPELGYRTYQITPRDGSVTLHVSSKDIALFKKGIFLRLMGLFNLLVENVFERKIIAVFQNEDYKEARRRKARLVHWLPDETGVPCEVVMPDGSNVKGLAEEILRQASLGQVIQFERFGFVRVDEIRAKIVTYFAHV